MKKIILSAILTSYSSFIFANNNFTSWHIGGELNTGKHSFTISEGINFNSAGKKGIGLAVYGGYGFDLSNNFISIGEARINIGGGKSQKDGNVISKEKYGMTLAYLQGYRVTDSILPYIKLGGELSVFNLNKLETESGYQINDETNGNFGAFGFVYGLGVKFAIQPNLDIGIEYTRSNLKRITEDAKFKTDKLSLKVGYSF
ncbi:outer membrane protein [Rodentibacter caecimuris]|uniref:Outer membrane protein beta-barrel domain-containing protein n=1 Tax=Rodentibacter caecimuris TaxID=1796644 RepID=A0ABX3L004_9PAST|nr:hypothetical protein BKG89_02855 [Rodentibacter heylii]